MKKYIGATLHIDSDDRFNVDYEIKGTVWRDENGDWIGESHEEEPKNFLHETKLQYPFLFLPRDKNGFVHLDCNVIADDMYYDGIKLLNIEQNKQSMIKSDVEDDIDSQYYGKHYDFYSMYFSKVDLGNETQMTVIVGNIDFGNNIIISDASVGYLVYYDIV